MQQDGARCDAVCVCGFVNPNTLRERETQTERETEREAERQRDRGGAREEERERERESLFVCVPSLYVCATMEQRCMTEVDTSTGVCVGVGVCMVARLPGS